MPLTAPGDGCSGGVPALATTTSGVPALATTTFGAGSGLSPPLLPGQREFQAGKMAVHAAMVDRTDPEIGRVLGQLRVMKALDDTLVFSLSDNGASAEIMVRGDGHDPDAACGTGAT